VAVKRDLKKVQNRLFAAIKRALNRKELTEIGRMAINMISARTRRGFGVAQAGSKSRPLKKLSAGYIAYRKKSSKLNTALTSPGKSNLTFTGQLLDSLIVREVDVEKQKVFVNANNRKRKGGKTNAEVAEFVSQQGREFLNLSRSEIVKIGRAFNNNLRANVKRNFERT